MTTGKHAFITGASEGIGRAFVTHLLKEGWQVTGVARNEARLKELGATDYLVADLSRTEDVQRLATHLRTKKYDLVVNNAGYGVYGAFCRMDLAVAQAMMRVNCDALVALSHAFLQTAERGAALINTSSVLALVPMPINGIYSATKAFVTSFSESLWAEQRRRGVYVMNLCPGATSTHFHARAGGEASSLPPAAVMQTPEQVVATAMGALGRRRCPTVVSGRKNAIMAFLPRLFSRRFVVSLMGRIDRL